MLVLSRGTQDKVVFPSLGVSVEVLRIANKRVRLGITAPNNVKVIRDELVGSDTDLAQLLANALPMDDKVRERLAAANKLLMQASESLVLDDTASAMSLLGSVLREFDTIDSYCSSKSMESEKPLLEKVSKRALLVDDNDNERELLAGYLRMSGFDVCEADDGLRALYRLSEKNSPDIVLLDMNMPGMDGQSTLSHIRENAAYAKLPVVAVSGSDPLDVGVVVGPKGVDAWYRKPVNPKLLLKQITDLIGPAA